MTASRDPLALLPPTGSISRIAHYVGSATFGGAAAAIVVTSAVAATLIVVYLVIPALRAVAARRRPGWGAAVVPAVWSVLLLAWFAAVAVNVHRGGTSTRFDRPALQWWVTHRTTWSTTVLRVVTDVGSPVVVGSVAVVGGLALWRKKRGSDAVLVLAGAVMASIGVTVSKHVVGVPRPPLNVRLVAEANAAFPSGHVVGALAIYGSLTVLTCARIDHRWVRVLLRCATASVVAVIALTRLYLGVHWLSDVVGAVLLGAALLLVFVAVQAVLSGHRSITATQEHPVAELAPTGTTS